METENTKQAATSDNSDQHGFLCVALDLGGERWQACLTDGKKKREVKLPAGDVQALVDAVDLAKVKLKLGAKVAVVSCYEAGRDGFWLHRALVERGIKNLVIDSASIRRSARKREPKTDRLDAAELAQLLLQHQLGMKKLCSVVRVPSEEDEDGRRAIRERETLVAEKTAESNRIRGLLKLHGIVLANVAKLEVDDVRDARGRPLLPAQKRELRRCLERRATLNEQIRCVEKELVDRIHASTVTDRETSTPLPEDRAAAMATSLQDLRGVGQVTSWQVASELSWRDFKNRKQVGAFAGLAPVPYSSGSMDRSLGISKAGSSRLRSTLVELAWGWLRFQPESKLARWYVERFASGGKRMRRIGIVALARRLLVDLWRYAKNGVVPEGAVLKTN